MCEMPARATISAFGFGYQMNSELLLQIAKTGNGAFSYIPDASMVGTVFCHAVSNALALAHFNCSALVAVRGAQDVSLLDCSMPADKLLTDDGVILRVPLGHLQPGQKRSLCLKLKLHSGADAAGFSVQVVCVTVFYGILLQTVFDLLHTGCGLLRGRCTLACVIL
jgi:hypothetical protein